MTVHTLRRGLTTGTLILALAGGAALAATAYEAATGTVSGTSAPGAATSGAATSGAARTGGAQGHVVTAANTIWDGPGAGDPTATPTPTATPPVSASPGNTIWD